MRLPIPSGGIGLSWADAASGIAAVEATPKKLCRCARRVIMDVLLIFYCRVLRPPFGGSEAPVHLKNSKCSKVPRSPAQATRICKRGKRAGGASPQGTGAAALEKQGMERPRPSWRKSGPGALVTHPILVGEASGALDRAMNSAHPES